MRRQAVQSTATQVADPGRWQPPRPFAISPDAVAEGVARVEAACRERRCGPTGLAAAVSYICRSAGFEVGHVYLSDTDTGRILPSHIWYLQPPASRFTSFVRTTAATALVPGQGLPGQVVCSNAPVFIDPLPGSAHMVRARAAIAAGLRAACGFPLEANARLTVVLEFLAGTSLQPSSDLDTLVEQLSAVLRPHLRELEADDLL